MPYESGGSARTSITTDGNLLTINSYDPLERLASSANVLGAKTTSYDQWQTSLIDREGNTKNPTYDAFGNLVQVVEHAATSTYSTTYTYEALSDLTNITDALAMSGIFPMMDFWAHQIRGPPRFPRWNIWQHHFQI